MKRDSARKRVAVIGAGAAGLVSARELARAGHDAVVFEQSDRIGGIWAYQPETESDPLGLAPAERFHGSLYASLRTNLPRDLMAFDDFPFEPDGAVDDESPQFVHHATVLKYLESFAGTFEVARHIRFNCPVKSVRRAADTSWTIEANGVEERFDAVMICNGHYSQPRVPQLPGLERFGGLLMHSHNYREPKPFTDRNVLIFGGAASGVDIAREIAAVAREVHWCAESFSIEPTEVERSRNIRRHKEPVEFDADGSPRLADGSVLSGIDAFLFCTGYRYCFPFLQVDSVRVTDNWVHPLHLDMVPPTEPTLAFIGLPFSVVPFPLFEIQARWFSRLLAGAFSLPSKSEMLKQCAERAVAMRDAGVKQRNFHKLGANQFAYMAELATQCGAPPPPAWRARLWAEVRRNRAADPDGYREIPLMRPY